MNQTEQILMVYDFLNTVEKQFHPPYSNFVLPDLITLDSPEENSIDVEWSKSSFKLLITLGEKENGGYGEWKNKRHTFKGNWNRSIKLKENHNILEELERFFLVNDLDERLRKPVTRNGQ